MNVFSCAGRDAIRAVADRYGFSEDAVSVMVDAIVAGRGRMAQFDHAEFGGSGQWMRGGMTMIADMFDAPRKARIERLCDELARLIAQQPETFAPPASMPKAGDSAAGERGWWPAELGYPDAAGSQNTMRYAYFSLARRLAVDASGRISVYDTLDHRIGGVAQRQSASASLTFSSQHGPIDVATLPLISGDTQSQRARESVVVPDGPTPDASSSDASAPDVFATIEKLADLAHKGILSDAEFRAKKTELLGRL